MGDHKPIYVFESKVSDLAKVYVNRIMDSGWIGLGHETEMFEKEFASYCGAKYAVGTNSATSALHILFEIIGVNGKNVITTPMTFVSTNMAILYAGGIPMFYDIDPDTFILDVDSLLRNYSTRTDNIGAVVIVNYGGMVLDYDSINEIQHYLGVPIVVDNAHAAGGLDIDGYHAGHFGNYNAFSFHAVKNIASSDGGAIVTNSERVYNMAKKLRWMGIDKTTYDRTSDTSYNYDYSVDVVGFKYHMNDVAAAICRAHLMSLDRDNARRRENARSYRNRIHTDFLQHDIELSSNHLTVMKLDKYLSNEFIHIMSERYNIHLGRHYYPNNKYGVFKKYESFSGVCDSLYNKIVTLPNHLKLTDDDVDYVVNSINEVLE